MAYLSNDSEEDQKQQASNQNSNFDIYSSASGNDQSQDTGSGAQAQQNAQTYAKTFSGGSTDNAPQQQYGAKPNAAQQQNQTGYINFQNYEQANPSESQNIASAGQKVIGGEKAKFEGAKGAFDAYKAPEGFSDQGSADNTIYGQLASDTYDPTQLKGWLNGTYTGPSGIDYTQGQDYMRDASQLSETPIMGGQTKPSALDYLARPNIEAGQYSLGNRTFDQALLAGDPNAQAAISGNAAQAKSLSDWIGQAMPASQTAAQGYAQTVQNNKSMANQALTDAQQKMGAAQEAAAQEWNAGQRRQMEDELAAYRDWYNGAGRAADRSIVNWNATNAIGDTAQAGQMVTPEQALVANRIAELNGASAPYADVNNPVATPKGGSFQWNIQQAPVGEVSQMALNTGSTSLGGKANQSFGNTQADREWANQQLAKEIARLEAKIRGEGKPQPMPNSPYYQGSEAQSLANDKALYASNNKTISGMDKSIYDYGKSLGLSDEEIASIGTVSANPYIDPYSSD